MEFLCKRDGMVDGIYDNHTSKQIGHDSLIDAVRGHQLICHSKHAGLAQCFFKLGVIPSGHTGKR